MAKHILINTQTICCHHTEKHLKIFLNAEPPLWVNGTNIRDYLYFRYLPFFVFRVYFLCCFLFGRICFLINSFNSSSTRRPSIIYSSLFVNKKLLMMRIQLENEISFGGKRKVLNAFKNNLSYQIIGS